MLHAALHVVLALPLAQRPPAEAAPEPPHPGALATPGADDVRAALRRGEALLLAARERTVERGARGSEPAQGAPAGQGAPAEQSTLAGQGAREWPYEGVYRVDGEIPLGYRVGGTSIAASALLAAAEGAPHDDARAAILGAVDFVLEALADPRLDRGFVQGYDVRGWAHAYALDFLLAVRAARIDRGERADRTAAAIRGLVELLAATEIAERGGWNYSRPRGPDSDPSTFMTASTLLALYEARRQGEAVDARVVERALAALEAGRVETGAFQYGTNPRARGGRRVQDLPGAVGRMAACEVALHLAGRGDVERLRGAVDAFFEHWRWLEQRRKQTGTHVPPFGIAPYYFYYAHRYAAAAIEFLPPEERAERRARLHALLWHVREEDGGWNDRVFPRSASFGTAMTMLALLEPGRARPAGWPAEARAAGGVADGAAEAGPEGGR
jgi:hypothetical protein